MDVSILRATFHEESMPTWGSDLHNPYTWLVKSIKSTSRPWSISFEVKLYFHLRENLTWLGGRESGLDQNGKLTCFLEVVLVYPPLLARVNILCGLASYFEGMDSSCKVDLKTPHRWEKAKTISIYFTLPKDWGANNHRRSCLFSHHPPPLMLTINNMKCNFLRTHIFCWPFLGPHLTTYHSTRCVHNIAMLNLSTSTLPNVGSRLPQRGGYNSNLGDYDISNLLKRPTHHLKCRWCVMSLMYTSNMYIDCIKEPLWHGEHYTWYCTRVILLQVATWLLIYNI